MLEWAQAAGPSDSPRVGGKPGDDLLTGAQASPGLPDPRGKKPRHRPNNGRKRTFVGPFLDPPPWGLLDATGYPIPRDLIPLAKVPRVWRSGERWRIWRNGVFAMWGSDCHLCGHPGADSADHLVPLSVWGNQPYDPRISRPAHGVAGCAVCHLKCNSSRGNKAWALHESRYQPPIQL